jgi:hypothetical protein
LDRERQSLALVTAGRMTARHVFAAWEAQAAQDGIQRGSAYRQAGWEWIAEQRKTRKARRESCRH